MPRDRQDVLDLNRMGEIPITIVGRLELNQLLRLRAEARPGGHADVQLQVAEEQGRRLVSGQIRAEIPLTCQRCLGTMKYLAVADVRLIWVRAGSEAVRIPDGYDAIVSASGRVRVAKLVEDELLLALPTVARHEPPDECAARFATSGTLSAMDTGAAGPFAVLEALRRH